MSQDKFIDISKYELLERIGSGAFAVVYKIFDKTNKKIYAAKISNDEVNLSTIKSEEILLLFREVNVLASFNHPAIIKFIGFNVVSFNNMHNPIIITEYAKNESLRKVINLETQGLSLQGWDDTKKLINIYGIASGMMYLHSHNILHRDLKPENILIDDCLCPRIADFGLSKVATFSKEKSTMAKELTSSDSNCMIFQSQSSIKGTPVYMAPESLKDSVYSPAGDVYAFSLIVYEIMTGRRPFEGFNQIQLYQNVIKKSVRPELTPDIPEAYKDLISSCWSENPDERPTFEMIVNNLKENQSFITDLVDENDFEDYVSIIDEYKASFDTSKCPIDYDEMIKKYFKVVDIKNDLKINHLYVMTTIKGQMIGNLVPSINEVKSLYRRFNSDYIYTVIDMLFAFVNLIDDGRNLPDSVPIVGGQISIENYFNISNDIFNEMSSKINELIGIMDKAGEEGVIPLTELMIQEVFCSLVRRLLFVANSSLITSVFDQDKDYYPFVNINPSLKNLMYQVFLRVYFSQKRQLLVPFYVYISLGFTLDMSFMANNVSSLIFFNKKFPLRITDERLAGGNLYKNLLLLATRIIREKNGKFQDPDRITFRIYDKIISMFGFEMKKKQLMLSKRQTPSFQKRKNWH